MYAGFSNVVYDYMTSENTVDLQPASGPDTATSLGTAAYETSTNPTLADNDPVKDWTTDVEVRNYTSIQGEMSVTICGICHKACDVLCEGSVGVGPKDLCLYQEYVSTSKPPFGRFSCGMLIKTQINT